MRVEGVSFLEESELLRKPLTRYSRSKDQVYLRLSKTEVSLKEWTCVRKDQAFDLLFEMTNFHLVIYLRSLVMPSGDMFHAHAILLS